MGACTVKRLSGALEPRLAIFPGQKRSRCVLAVCPRMEPSTAPAPEVPLSARRAEERFCEVVDEVDVAAEELIALLKLVGA